MSPRAQPKTYITGLSLEKEKYLQSFVCYGNPSEDIVVTHEEQNLAK